MKDIQDVLRQAKTAVGQQQTPTSTDKTPSRATSESLFQNPLAALVNLTISPEMQNAFNQETIAQLQSGFRNFVSSAVQAKEENEQKIAETEAEFREMVEEEKAKIAAENEPNLREIARLAAEAEMNYYGVGKRNNQNLFHQTQTYQLNGNSFRSSTTVIAALNGATETNGKGFGK